MRAFASLRRRNDFARVQRRGKRRVGRYIVALITDGQRPTRVGITVSKSVGGAVVRNRVRRRIKYVLDGLGLGSAPYRDIVLIARPGLGSLDFIDLAAEVRRLVG